MPACCHNVESYRFAWIAYQKTTNVFIDTYLEEASSLNYYWYSLGPVALGISTYTPMSDNEINLFKRFKNVFELAYRRYLDIEKAEAQAREAQIELALERVRARTMAMQKSDELLDAAVTLFQQVKLLGAPAWSCGYSIWDDNRKFAKAWMGSEYGIQASIKVPVNQQVFARIYEAAQRGEILYVEELNGKVLEAHYKFMHSLLGGAERFKGLAASGLQLPAIQILHNAFFSHGYLLFITIEPVPELWEVFKRFAKVFEQTYTRFLDLQKAEAQAREAIKASSLDRVRGEIASMRNADDLQRITPLVWRELTALGVPFFRCGVMIINEEEEKVRFYLSTPDGHPLAALNLPFESSEITKNPVINWRLQKVYTDHWNKEQFIANTKLLIELGQIQMANTYQGGEEPPESITLQFVPFQQGMMYVGSAEPLTASQIDLVQALAETFSVAYARYEDFTKLEAAKAQVENTLTELKATQKQLIQSEKMASLGELTAGIAHEIQNPLNFVNNFSEVSNELIDEMNEELDKGDIDEAKAIATDIKQNLEKINHHGKRADAIVKGMLQHSRTSTGKKEPTDINALCDEYLRLSYHGLRAKDKDFNATMQTDFDESIGKINIVPQDIGRVLLNLYNNAFYAVAERKKSAVENYQPTVSIITKRISSPLGNEGIEIRVADNGNGIPQKVVDKIFQPFFTTKPTGQGTGLGLSLSYDIIKAHGGEIKVETKEGNGTTIIIQLPNQTA